MKLIVGLGNPGRDYEKTRHNTGFMALDLIAKELNISVTSEKFKGLYGKGNVKGESVILLKPQTYMNLSGESVRAVMDFFKIDKKDLLVIYDDLDLPVGKIRLRAKGSAGGQNGVKNIIQQLTESRPLQPKAHDKSKHSFLPFFRKTVIICIFSVKTENSILFCGALFSKSTKIPYHLVNSAFL